MLLFEVLDDLAVVVLVGELDILEQEARHRELQLVRLLHLPLHLLTQLGQCCRAFCGIMIDITLSTCTHRALLQPTRYLRRDATDRRQHRVVVGFAGVALDAPHIFPRKLGRQRIRV